MIFDCEHVTLLVEEWKSSRDILLLDNILAKSNSLIEAIVSTFNPEYRDDLIQEARAKVIYALPFFDDNISNLHTFLTTVIKNICISYTQKQYKRDAVLDIDIDYLDNLIPKDSVIELDISLDELIARNRKRFPSIPVDTIDSMSEHIYYGLSYGEKYYSIITTISNDVGCSKGISKIVLYSTMMYMRARLVEHAVVNNSDNVEMTLLPDIKEIFGSDAYHKFSAVMAGMYIRFP